MDPSQLSKYITGRSTVGPVILEKFLGVFPLEHHADLLRAYLLDQMPHTHRHLLEIRRRDGDDTSSSADQLFEALPEDIRQALRIISARCDERPVYELVIDLARLLDRRAKS